MAYNPADIPTFSTTVKLLAAYPTGAPVPAVVFTLGRTTVERGGAFFRYDATDTTTADNGGTVRVDGGGRRWKYVGEIVHTDLFGLAVGTGSHTVNDPIFATLNTLGVDILIDPAPVLNPSTNYYEVSAAVTVAATQSYSAAFGTAYIKQVTSGANCMAISSGTTNRVSGIWFYATGDDGGQLLDSGLVLSGCTDVKVFDCLFSGQRMSGVVLYNSTNCEIYGNFFVDSPVTDSDASSDCNADIFCAYASSGNSIHDNFLTSGNGTAIQVQAIGTGAFCNDNIIYGNIIDGYKVYGIIAYNAGTGGVLRTLIYGNNIKNISGSLIYLPGPNTYPFGSGIYIQGAEYSSVFGNQIDNTHSYARSFALNLAPGSIGFANVGAFECHGNICGTDAISNIFITDANGEGLEFGLGLVQSNTLTDAPNSINIVQRGNLIIEGNGTNGATDAAITINNSTTHGPYRIVGNVFSGNSDANYGINALNCSNIFIEDNDCDGAATYFILVSGASIAWVIRNNSGRGLLSRGIQYESSTGDAIVGGNILQGSGGATQYGIGALSPCLILPNQVSGFAAPFSASSTDGFPIAQRTEASGSITLLPCNDAPIQVFVTTLSNNLTITLSTAGAVPGSTRWRVVSPASLGGHTFTVGGVSLTASQSIEFDVALDGASYLQTTPGTLL